MIPKEFEGTTQGQVLAQSLQTALAAALQEDPVLSATTPAGNVTAVRLATPAATGPTVLQLNRTRNPGSPLTVVLPPALIQDVSSGGNAVLVVTEVKDEVAGTLPHDGADGKVMVNSPIIELSFAKEASGEVAVLDIVRNNDTIVFAMLGRPPVPGESCAFFNSSTGLWSNAGVQLMSSFEVGGEIVEASWCRTSHTSMFTILESVPFDVLYETDTNNMNASGYTVVLALVAVVWCIGGTVLCVLCLRRVRPPSSGRAKLMYAGGGAKQMSFQCSRVITEPVEGDTTPKRGKAQKVLVKWDIEPEEMVEDLDKLRGYRGVTRELGGPQHEVVQIKSETSHLSRASERLMTQRSLQNLENIFGGLDPDDGEEEHLGRPYR